MKKSRRCRRCATNIGVALLLFLGLWIVGCQSMEPMPTVNYVDLDRFMGDWYVIASIPTFIEKEAFNAVESYRLAEDGTIETTFTFNKGGFDGPLKTYHPRGFVRDKATNAVWGMQVIWPIKSDYRIIYLSEDYSETVIGRTKRDYVWIMARSPSISDETAREILGILKEQKYDPEKLRWVPHKSDKAPKK